MLLLRPFKLKPSFFTGLLHIALVIILTGACVTHFFGVQGEVHLRNDKAVTVSAAHSAVSLFLWDFHIVYDGQTPVDYVSELRLLDRSAKDRQQKTAIDEGVVRMNRPLRYHGFRFCQSDYDSDELGVTLRYNYDPWGIGITYTGYAMLLVAMLGFFFQSRTRFRVLIRSLASQKKAIILLSALVVLVVILAVVMTKVVTPKPPLQPVLQTPMLGIHVSVIMLAYTLFAIVMVNGILGIYACIAQKKATGERKEKLAAFNLRLTSLSQLLLYPAVFCLTAGIFIGAVWANMSWGRYWGWDPKETWALITMLVYAVLMHWHLIRTRLHIVDNRAQVIYHIFSIAAFVFVLFTYFGVNMLLGGLHSYQ